MPLLSYDPMELEIGFGLIPLVDVSQGGDLLERITMIRRHAARELGIVVPPIRVRDNLQLKPSTYVVKIYGLEVTRAEVMVSRLLAMNPGTATGGIDGIPTTEPAFGLPALWVAESARGDAEMAGYTVIDPTSVIATHLTEIIKTHAPDLLGRQETSALLDNVKQHYPVVVEELVPNLLTVGEIQRVLQNLLRERIPIRNLLLILENLADGARASKDVDYLTERVRSAMARHICAEYAENGLLSVITVDPRLETLLGEAVRRGEDAYALLDPGTVAKIYASLTRQIGLAQQSGLHPIVLTSPSTRLALKRLTERAAPSLVVLSYSEIAPGLRVESLGQISTTDEQPRAGRSGGLSDAALLRFQRARRRRRSKRVLLPEQQRAAVRLDVTVPGQWRYAPGGKGAGEYIRGSITDISRTGASLTVDREIKTRDAGRDQAFRSARSARPLVLLGRGHAGLEDRGVREDRRSGCASSGSRPRRTGAIMEFINKRQAERRSRGLA